jgi:hypothetical protein
MATRQRRRATDRALFSDDQVRLCIADLEARARLSERVVISAKFARTIAAVLSRQLRKSQGGADR